VSLPRKLPITLILISYNEEIHLERCLSRIAPWVARVVLIDSFSTDATAAIAEKHGAEVLKHPFKNHADQFRWGLQAAAPATEWVMRIDCDEYFEDGALAALGLLLSTLPADVTGVNLRRKLIFREKWIRHGRYYPVVILRLWRNGAAEMEQRWMDEHMALTRGRAVLFEGGDLVDYNLAGLGAWTAKHNRYATLAMVDAINREYPLFDEDRRIEANPSAARRNRFLKNSVYGRAPLYLRAVLLFLYRYVIRLGFLDGRIGFAFHALHGFWLFLLIDAKIDEARDFIRARGVEAFKQRLRAERIEL
jgi:glycosyltransferase involved in cell wall biosynthesis